MIDFPPRIRHLLRRAFLLLLSGCAFSQPHAQPAERSARVSAAELDKSAYAFADRYTTQIVAATDTILRGNPSAEQRRAAHQVKLVSVSGIYDIVTGADPATKLMDLLMVVTLQSYRWIDEDHADKTFGVRGEPLIRAMRGLRVDIWNVAGRVLRADQLQQLDGLILDWRKRNPQVDILSYLRFDEVANQRGSNALAEIKASGLFAEIAEATRVADDARLLAERAFYQAKRMPFLLSWQMEGLMNEMLMKPEFAQSIKAADSLAQSADRTSLAVAQLPDHLAREREAILAAFDNNSTKLGGLLAQVREITGAADQLTARVHKVAESGERLSLNLRDTAQGFTQTSNAVDALLTRHAGAPDPAAKPFDIEPYARASGELNRAVAGLNILLAQTDGFLAKGPWREPARDINLMLDAQIDRIFWRVLLLIVLFFVLLAAYRWLTRYWAQPS